MIACPDLETLDLLDSGSLDLASRTSLASHLETCTDCRARLRDVRRHRELAGRLRDVLDTDAADGVEAGPDAVPGCDLLREIHRGGQGIVYEARQRSTDRRVAVKVRRQGADASPRHRRRFEREMDVLTSLRHPGIVTLYDRGVTDDGRAYFVMELVEGRTLDAHVRETAPSLEARLELVARICDAVGAAHQRGVMHRDLKPANAVVQPDGAPRVLDFGLAKIADEAPAREERTEAGAFMGTLAYASPEQVAGRPEDVDVRTDVHALGVILFELLAGRLPWDLDGSLRDVVARIEAGPRPPVSRVAPGLDADLDAIVATCLAPEPHRRYPSVAALGADLDRYRAGLPVAARGDGRWYVLGKMLRRHRGLFAAALLVMATLVAGALGFRHQAGIAVAARDRAEDEAARLQTVLGFVERMLTSVDPGRDGRAVTVYDTLDRAESDVAGAVGARPEVASSLHAFMGTSYHALGEYERALGHLEAAVRTGREAHPDDPARFLPLHARIGTALVELGRYEEALALETEALPEVRRHLGDDDPTTLSLLNILASAHRKLGQWQESVPMLREVVRRREAAFGPDDMQTITSRINLANVLEDLERHDEAVAVFGDVVETITAQRGPRDPVTLRARNNLGFLLEAAGRDEEALALRREVLAVRRDVLGPEHPDTLTAMNNLALHLSRRGRDDESIPLLRETIEVRDRVLGPTHPDTLTSRHNLATALQGTGAHEAAATLHAETVAGRRAVLGDVHPLTALSLHGQGTALLALDRAEAAVPLLVEAVATCRAALPDGHSRTRRAMASLGEAWRAAGRPEEARPVLEALLAARTAALGAADRRTVEAAEALADVLAELGATAEAADVLRASLASVRSELGDGHALAERLESGLSALR